MSELQSEEACRVRIRSIELQPVWSTPSNPRRHRLSAHDYPPADRIQIEGIAAAPEKRQAGRSTTFIIRPPSAKDGRKRPLIRRPNDDRSRPLRHKTTMIKELGALGLGSAVCVGLASPLAPAPSGVGASKASATGGQSSFTNSRARPRRRVLDVREYGRRLSIDQGRTSNDCKSLKLSPS